MADDSFAQVKAILDTVIRSPMFNGKGQTFYRTLIVTPLIKDIKVSENKVQVHPEWAVELGPIDAAKKIISMCEEFDEKRRQAHATFTGTLFHQLVDSIEACRRAGREDLIQQAFESTRSVPKSRSLVRIYKYE